MGAGAPGRSASSGPSGAAVGMPSRTAGPEAHRVDHPRQPSGPPQIQHYLERFGLVHVVAPDIAQLGVVRVYGDAMLGGPPDRGSHMVDMAVREHYCSHILWFMTQCRNGFQYIIAIARIARVEECDARIIRCDHPIDRFPVDHVYGVADLGDLHHEIESNESLVRVVGELAMSRLREER